MMQISWFLVLIGALAAAVGLWFQSVGHERVAAVIGVATAAVTLAMMFLSPDVTAKGISLGAGFMAMFIIGKLVLSLARGSSTHKAA